jgi:hypothetical protein
VLLVPGLGPGCSTNAGCSCSWFAGKSVEATSATDVELIGDGSDPRVSLRVARWTGLRYRMNLVTSGSLGLEKGAPIVGPTTTMVIDSEVLRGSAEPFFERRHGGTVQLIQERSVLRGISIVQQGIPQPVVDFWNLALAPLRGTSYLQNVAESAEVTELNSELLGGVQPPEEISKAVDATLEQQRHFPFRLPPAPVGVGATWRFHESLLMNGAKVTQTAEMTLKSVDANQAVIGVVIHQDAARQDVTNPLEPTAKATLEHFSGEGGGELVVDRLTAIILEGSVVVAARSTLGMELSGTKSVATLIGASSLHLSATMLAEPDAGAVR